MQINSSIIMTGLKMSISGLLAMFFIIFFKLNFGFWAVVTVAAMTCNNDSATIQKGLMRLLGTVVGAIAGYVIAINTIHSHFETSLYFFLALFVFTFISLQETVFSYAGLVAGITTAIVIGENFNTQFLLNAALYRTGDVMLGVAITAAVGWFFMRKKDQKLGFFQLENKNFGFSLATLKCVTRISITATLTYLFFMHYHIPGGFWMTISCLFVMEESIDKTVQQGIRRFIAHVIACFIGFIAAITFSHNTMHLAIVLGIAFFFLGMLVAQPSPYHGMGNTIGIAVATIMLSGIGQSNILDIALTRFLNVCAGIGIGIFMTRYFLPNKQ